MKVLEARAPWGIDDLQLVERPDPVPGRGKIAIRMKAASLNYRDLVLLRTAARDAAADRPPYVPFSDGCGVVEAVGPGANRFRVGDRVVPMFYPEWIAGRSTPAVTRRSLGSASADGVAQEVMVLGERDLEPAPDFLSDAEVATLPCAAVTAWRALFVDARATVGDTVVLQGTGGVSIFGLQFAHAAGLKTIVTSSSDEKLARAKALGADHLINYTAQPDWSAQVRDLTGGAGADVVLEVGGAATLSHSLRAVRRGGHIAVIGVLTDGASGKPFNPGVMIATEARLQGLSVGSHAMFADMCKAMELHGLHPVIHRSYAFADSPSALRDMEQGQHFGKIVIEF